MERTFGFKLSAKMCLLLILATSFLFGFVSTEDYVHDKETCSGKDAISRYVHCNWYYIAYSPRIIRPGVDENVVVSTHNISFDVNVTASLLSDKRVIAKSSETVVKPGRLTNIMIKLSHEEASINKGELVIAGHGEIESGTNGVNESSTWTFKNSSSISVEQIGMNVFIQTDRPIYKPGETIRMRVLAIRSDLKPVTDNVSLLVINNPSGSRMRQWINVPLEKGFASFNLPLSKRPVLGKWKIEATVKEEKKILQIEVGKYVLPKFQVKIKPPKSVVRVQKTISFSICAKYSYGKDVTGKLTGKCCLDKGRWGTITCVELARKIAGCSSFDIDSKDIGFNNIRYYQWDSATVTIEAYVKEKATDITLNATQTSTKVTVSNVSFSYDGTPSVFKPGLPFRVILRATHLDGSPIKKNIDVDFAVYLYIPDRFRSPHLPRKFQIRNGFIQIHIPSFPLVEIKKVRLEVKEWRHREKLYPLTSHRLHPWYSPSFSYLSIDKPTEQLKIGPKISVNINYTSVDDTSIKRKVYYSFICKGYIAQSGSLEHEFIAAKSTNSTANNYAPTHFSRGTFNLSFELTQQMSPSCGMIVYYIRGKETVADSKKVDIEVVPGNKVTVRFDQSEVEPGSQVKLILSADPGSRFAIAAVDKSVHFLRKGNDIRPNQLLKIQEQLWIRSRYISYYDRCTYRNWELGRKYDSQKAFNDIGMIFVSNLWVDTVPCHVEKTRIIHEIDFEFDELTAAPTTEEPQVLLTESPTAPPATEEPWVPTEAPTEPAAEWPPEAPTMGKTTEEPNVATTSTPAKKKHERKERKQVPKIRTEFPETWLWTEEEINEETGQKIIKVNVPDTITTWYASGFAVSGTTGFGIANPAELKAFRPFFISLTLPYSVIRGEFVTVPVSVFNYLSKCLTVRVSLKESQNYFIIAGPKVKVCVCGGRTAAIHFRIKPNMLGRIPIQVKTESLQQNACKSWLSYESNITAIDSIRRKLLVEAEGIEHEYNYNSMICPKGFPNRIKLTSPESIETIETPKCIAEDMAVDIDIFKRSYCPYSHSYAYYNGQYCCKTNKEKHYHPQGALCDGSQLQFSSLCCEDDKHFKCRQPPCYNYPPSASGNIARGKPTSQSSTAYSGLSSFAVDGNTNPNYFGSSCTHTRNQKGAWWRVDFGKHFHVNKVMLTNRADCCWYRLRRLEIRVGNNRMNPKANQLCTSVYGAIRKGETRTLMCRRVLGGRYVFVVNNVKEYLTLCEVQVFALTETNTEPPPTTNVPRTTNVPTTEEIPTTTTAEKDGPFSDAIKLTLPKNVVPGSVYSKITVIGDLMGPSLSGISDLLKMPCGCGEQNMVKFAPNIFIMRYLMATFQLTDDIKEKSENYMRSGYQQELIYKHTDGGYSAFQSDYEASMWLTAFVLKSFAQARTLIDIDDKDICDAKRWIFRHQSRDGCFQRVGLLHNKLMKGGVSTPVTLTGYVIISLLEAGVKINKGNRMYRALRCIQSHLKSVSDSYSTAILAYTMAKAGKPVELKLMLDKLEELAIKDGDMMHWEAPGKIQKKYRPYHTARSADIEITSYALLAFISNKDSVIKMLPVVRWLSQQRNSLGGWASTQDTVLAMQALSEFSSLVSGHSLNLTISVANKEFQKEFRIIKDNSLVLQRVEVPKVPTVLNVSGRGEGCALLQVSVKYNIKAVEEEPAFAIDVKIFPYAKGRKLRNGRCATQIMTVCARWLKEDVSNMAIISVRMVSGFVPTPASLAKAFRNNPSLKEHEMEENTLNLYFNSISPKNTCVVFKIKQTNIVQNTKPASVKVYDYYDNDLSATVIYKITKEMCRGK